MLSEKYKELVKLDLLSPVYEHNFKFPTAFEYVPLKTTYSTGYTPEQSTEGMKDAELGGCVARDREQRSSR